MQLENHFPRLCCRSQKINVGYAKRAINVAKDFVTLTRIYLNYAEAVVPKMKEPFDVK